MKNVDRSELKVGDDLESGTQMGLDGSVKKLFASGEGEEEWCVSDMVESKEMLSQLVVEIPMDEDDVAVVTASRRKPRRKRK
jgi:hypothetical protein